MNAERKIMDLELEQFVLGELPPKRAREIKHQVETDIEVQRRHDALMASTEEIFERYPPPQMAREITARADLKQTKSKTKWFAFRRWQV